MPFADAITTGRNAGPALSARSTTDIRAVAALAVLSNVSAAAVAAPAPMNFRLEIDNQPSQKKLIAPSFKLAAASFSFVDANSVL
jgi:hypothetical protein